MARMLRHSGLRSPCKKLYPATRPVHGVNHPDFCPGSGSATYNKPKKSSKIAKYSESQKLEFT